MALKTIQVDEELLRTADVDFQRAVDAEANKRLEAYKAQHPPAKTDAAIETDAQLARDAAKKLGVPTAQLVTAVDAGCSELKAFKDAQAEAAKATAAKIAGLVKNTKKDTDETRKAYADSLTKLPAADLTLMLDTLQAAQPAKRPATGAGPALTGKGDQEDAEEHVDNELTVGNWDPASQKWVTTKA